MRQAKSKTSASGEGKALPVRWGRLCTGVTAALLTVALLQGTDRSERVTELPRNASDAFISVRAGSIYYVPFRRGEDFILSELPLHGGRARRLVIDPAPTLRIETIQVTSSGIYYAFGEPGEPTANSGPGPAPAALSIGSARPHWENGALRWPRLSRKRLRRVPVTGGSPAEMIPTEHASSIQIRGDHLYWIRSRRTGDAWLTRQTVRPQGELMVAPLAGGPYRQLGKVNDDASLQPSGAGICWRQASPHHTALLTCGPPDFHIEAFPDFPSNNVPAWSGDRVYWLDGEPLTPMPQALPRVHTLMSARRDGTDRRLEWEVDTLSDTASSLSSLYENGADLFLTVDRQRDQNRTRKIVRFRTAREGPPETLLQLAGASAALQPLMVDGEYLYLLTWEERENWLDWSRAGLMRRRVGVLRRVRLPT